MGAPTAAALWRQRARALKAEALALRLAVRHPRTPWPVKALAAVVVAYAFSPIDLIPDVIPVLGLLDDLVLVPLGVWLVVRLLPADVWAACRAEAARTAERPVSWVAAVGIVVVWLASAVLVGRWLWSLR